MKALVRPSQLVAGTTTVPGDKSISHRAALLGAIASGPTEIRGFLEGEDCLRTLSALQALGVEVTRKGAGHYLVQGVGLEGLHEPDDVVDCGNAGTTARLLLGILAGQPFGTLLTGDESLRRRPMGRVAEPLRRMGAQIVGRDRGRRLPLAIAGSRPLTAIDHVSEVASAQVKSAILLAGLWAAAPVLVTEPLRSRDHTERMLAAFGAKVVVEELRVTLFPRPPLRGCRVEVPGDLSSAAFFLVAGALASEGGVTLRGVGVNPTRTGLLDTLRTMGVDLEVRAACGEVEPSADLTVRPSRLEGTTVAGSLVPRAIDELPIIAVAAACAGGVTEVRDAAELRVKESDRLRALVVELGKMGVTIAERPDGFRIEGQRTRRRLRGAHVSSWGDHRLAMALIVAGLNAEGVTVVDDIECVATSCPEFIATCRVLCGEQAVEVAA